jgi:hypothetical protein
MTTRKASKRPAKAAKPRTRADVAGDVLAGLAGAATAAGVAHPAVGAIAALAAFLHTLPAAAVEVSPCGGFIREKGSDRALCVVDDATASMAAAYGFGG